MTCKNTRSNSHNDRNQSQSKMAKFHKRSNPKLIPNKIMLKKLLSSLISFYINFLLYMFLTIYILQNCQNGDRRK